MSRLIHLFRGVLLGALLCGCATAQTDPVRQQMIEEMVARRQIEELIIDYTYYHDRRDASAIVDMFTEDATIQVGDGTPTVGREAIMQRFANRPGDRFTRHVTTNVRITLQDADHADATRVMIYYATEPSTDRMITAPRGVTEYEESFVRGLDGKWRFQSRRITPLFGPP